MVVVARAATITEQQAAQTTNVHSSSSITRTKTLDVLAKASANILGLIKGVRPGMTTKSCSNVSTLHATHLSANAVVDTVTRPANVAFQMTHLGLISKDTIRKKRKGKLA
jgi:hypothetical protein